MKLIILLIGILLPTTWGMAQEPLAWEVDEEPQAMVLSDAHEYNLWNLRPGDTTRVFADVAYIRDYPSAQSNLIDSLPVGQEVFVKGLGYNPAVIRGFYAPWCEIYYYKNQQKMEGYIWMGLLALSTETSADDNIFVHGFSRYANHEYSDQQSYYTAGLKLLNPQLQLLGETVYHVYDAEQSYQFAALSDGMGLDNIEHIHRFTYSGEACGIPTVEYHMGWTGKEFVHLPQSSSVSDAGIFYYGEEILYPSDHHGDKNLILKRISEGEITDYDALEPEFEEKEWEERYQWDGKTLTQLLELKTVN